MNKVFLSGRLTANPTSFASANTATANAKFDLAVNDSRNKNETYFLPCIAFGPTANFTISYLKKGDFVIVEGRITRRSYTSKDGKKLYSTDIVIENLQPVSEPNRSSVISSNTTMNSTRNMNANITSKQDDKVSIDEAFIDEENNNLTKQNQVEQTTDDELPDWMNDLEL